MSTSVSLLIDVARIVGRVANSEDPDRMVRSLASGLGLHCFLRPVGPNI